jgi:cell division transport system permease protein
MAKDSPDRPTDGETKRSGAPRRGDPRRTDLHRVAAAAPVVTTVARAEGGRAIVPPQSVAGRALVSVVAIMCFLACLAVGALSVIRSAAQDWQVDVSREATVQIKPIGSVGMEMRLARTLALARETPGVRSARLVDERESTALLEPWLGQGLDLSSLPVPRLVVVELEDPATADLTGLRAALDKEVEGAVLDDHAVWAARLRTMAGAAVLVGVGVVFLVFAAMILSIVFATRAAMAGNREVIEVLHFVGAEDAFIAREFRRHFVKLGLEGGLVGGGAALVFFVLVGAFLSGGASDGLAEQARALFGAPALGWSGVLGVAATVGVVTALTGVTSRATVLGHLRRLE